MSWGEVVAEDGIYVESLFRTMSPDVLEQFEQIDGHHSFARTGVAFDHHCIVDAALEVIEEAFEYVIHRGGLVVIQRFEWRELEEVAVDNVRNGAFEEFFLSSQLFEDLSERLVVVVPVVVVGIGDSGVEVEDLSTRVAVEHSNEKRLQI